MPTPTTLMLALLSTASAGDLDDTWQAWLDTSPPLSVSMADELSDRADVLVTQMDLSNLDVTGEFDVVTSGGGNYGAFYMGVSMVFSRVADQTTDVSFARHAGASAGGMLPFEIALKGERKTLEHHISYGILTRNHQAVYSFMPVGAFLQDHHWRQMAGWQTLTYAADLPDLDGKIFLATSCLAPLPTLVMIDAYTHVGHQASRAFMATGTYYQWYDGMPCTDGGALSGPNMTPLFQDGARDQIVVDLMHTGYPSTLIWSIRLELWLELVRMGQDAAVEFLTTGATSANPALITRCPAGAQVDRPRPSLA